MVRNGDATRRTPVALMVLGLAALVAGAIGLVNPAPAQAATIVAQAPTGNDYPWQSTNPNNASPLRAFKKMIQLERDPNAGEPLLYVVRLPASRVERMSIEEAEKAWTDHISGTGADVQRPRVHHRSRDAGDALRSSGILAIGRGAVRVTWPGCAERSVPE